MSAKTILSRFLVIVALFLIVSPAYADTDYHCLNLCVSGGKPEATCMPQCTYGHSAEPLIQSSGDIPLPPTPQTMPNHRLLSPLQPISSTDVLIKPKAKSPYHSVTDYRCVSQCLQGRMQYSTCEQSCTSITTKNGSVVLPYGVSTQSEAVHRNQLRQQAAQLQAQQVPATQPIQQGYH